MNLLARISRLRNLYIFENIPQGQRSQSHMSWWSAAEKMQGKAVPNALVSTLMLTSDVCLLSLVFLIWFTSHAPMPVTMGIEILYLSSFLLFIFSRASREFLAAIIMYCAVVILAMLLNIAFPGGWGVVVLYVLCATTFYRFPLQWSIPLIMICTLALITSSGSLHTLLAQHPANVGPIAINLSVLAGLTWFGWTRRVEYRLVVQLHEVQDQLREQMKHSEELATERERSRIARDIHDVLSHSLAVLSIQVQAAKHLVTRDPERLTAKLDDMAALIRESITESRSVVGLLREKPSLSSAENTVSVSLQSISTTFGERTGIHCRFEESGTPHTLSLQHRETLQQALREMLTNAHRHGAAHTVWITLRWREASIVLEVRDDGAGASVAASGVGGHHGLQGMRERAAVLGGEVEAGGMETGGFAVSIRLPYEQSSQLATR